MHRDTIGAGRRFLHSHSGQPAFNVPAYHTFRRAMVQQYGLERGQTLASRLYTAALRRRR